MMTKKNPLSRIMNEYNCGKQILYTICTIMRCEFFFFFFLRIILRYEIETPFYHDYR